MPASGEGSNPSASSLARTNRSIGLRGQRVFFTAGSVGRSGRSSDQWTFHGTPVGSTS